MLQAVIMAGGVGSRLRPLTCDLPKPMARLCGRPNIEYILELLKEHGVTDAAVTVQYLPQRISEHFDGGEYCGINLTFVEETEPLGTAGSVKNAAKYFAQSSDYSIEQGAAKKSWPKTEAGDVCCIVISGDAMCDFDLTAAYKHHRKSGAAATILVKAVDDPREYGLVDVDEDGDVRAFVEKPCFSQAVSNLANTGVYILSQQALALVPSHQQYDFAKDLFPKLLSKGLKIATYEDNGYWCDIGDIESYRRCQQDMLQGKVRCRIDGARDHAGNIFKDSRPRGNYTIVPPVYIGTGVEIGEGTVIDGMSVIDDGSAVGAGARISGSILLPDSYTGKGCTLTGAVICAGASAQQQAMLFENSVLGAGAVAGAHSVIRQGVRVWANKHVEAGVTLRDNLQYGAGRNLCFEDNGLSGEAGVELTPELAVRLGLAVGSTCKEGRVGIGCTTDRAARVLAQALVSGILSAGCDALDFGAGFEAMFRFNLAFCGLKLGVFISGGETASLRLFTVGGLPATRAQERAIEGTLQRGEYKRCSCTGFGEVSNLTGMRVLYENELIKFAPQGLSDIGVQVKSANRELEGMLRQTLYRLGVHQDDTFTLQISPDGGTVSITHAGSGYLPHSKALALCCLSEFEQGADVALPFDFPRIMDELAVRHGVAVRRYLSCPADDSDRAARELACVQLWSRDALMLSIKLLAYLKNKGLTPAQLFLQLPGFDTASVMVKTGKNPAGILRELSRNGKNIGGQGIGEGVVLRDDRGVVMVCPLKRGGGIKLVAEAHNSETAMELCESYEKLIKPLISL
ncbi:sugar phosphate nucleotidyltransferase [Hydrogenoanaerobacterium sp.]|uniref:sugar phosphate nucleotidyltransferase n=1 Tax=Hydrogenoanaerobacterium sp. TaxID=2953763 RepID=UPI0028A09221|nr:sugar phosphate nucleotidyltransferase [Hydrogenoanaerobacterium sp.]